MSAFLSWFAFFSCLVSPSSLSKSFTALAPLKGRKGLVDVVKLRASLELVGKLRADGRGCVTGREDKIHAFCN